MFARFTNYPLVTATPGVVGVVGFAGKPAPVPEAIMTLLMMGFDEKGVRLTSSKHLRKGQNVHITAGPFAGQHGVITADYGLTVKVLLQILGDLHSVRVPVGLID